MTLQKLSPYFLFHRISKGIQQSLLVIAGNAFTQGISAIAIIILTRSLGPTTFGEFSVGFSILLLLNRINDFGMTAVVQKYAARESNKKKINQILSQTSQLKLIGAVAIFVIGSISYQWIAQQLHFRQPLIILFSFIFNLVIVLYEHMLTMLQSLHRFSEAVIANFIQSSIKMIGVIVLALTHSIASIPAFLLFGLAPAIPLFFKKNFFPSWISLNLLQPITSQSKARNALALHSSIAFITAGIIENVDILFLQKYLNSYEAGLFAGITRIALLFNLAAYSLANVLNPRVARYTHARDLTTYLRKAWLVASACLIGFLLFLPVAHFSITFTIGQAYSAGTFSLVLLMAAAFLSIATIPFIAIFYSVDEPWYFSISGILQLAIILAGNVLFVPTGGIEGAAWTKLAARISLFLFTVLAAIFSYYKNHTIKLTSRRTT